MQSRTIFSVFLAGALTLAAAAAMAFDLKDSNGQTQRLTELKGKWVVVNFWATWCAPCVKEIPEIAGFARDKSQSVRVLGVALDWDSEKQVTAFARKVGHTYPLVLGTDKSEKTFGRMKGLPTTIVYNPAGKEVYRKTGTVTRELLDRIINGEIEPGKKN